MAGDSSQGAGTYAAPFLRIPAGARLMASPDVVVGMTPDASTVFSNPAFLSDIHSTELFLSTASWLEDLNFSAASGVFHAPGELVVGLGATLLYSGGLQGYDASLNVVDEDNYHDTALSATVARRIGDFSLGARATYLRQYIVPAHGNGYTFGLGASYERGPNFAHAAALNIGGQVQFDAVTYPIDGDAMLGVGRVFNTGVGRIVAGAEMVFSGVTDDRLILGADYQMGRHVTLRASIPDLTGGPTVAGGLGVAYGTMHLDYAYTPVEYFSGSHTVSIVFGFGAGSTAVPPGTGYSSHPVDSAPVISPSQIQAPPSVTPAAPSYILVAGNYGSLAEAKQAAASLESGGVLTEIEPLVGATYRVVVGRYTSQSSAQKALSMYASGGHRFVLVVE